MLIENKPITLANNDFIYPEHSSRKKDDKDKKIYEIIEELRLIAPEVLNFLVKNFRNYNRLIPLITQLDVYTISHRIEELGYYYGLYNFTYKDKKVCIYFAPWVFEHYRESIIPDLNEKKPIFRHNYKFIIDKIKFGYYIHEPDKKRERTGSDGTVGFNDVNMEFQVTDMPHAIDFDLLNFNEKDEDLGENLFDILRSFDFYHLEQMIIEIKNDSLEKWDKRLHDLEIYDNGKCIFHTSRDFWSKHYFYSHYEYDIISDDS